MTHSKTIETFMQESCKDMHDSAEKAEKGFRHLTFNTGHCMIQSMKYFHPNPVINANLRQLVQDALQPKGVEVIDNLFFELAVEDNKYLGIVYSLVGEEKNPFLLTCGAKTEEAGVELWNYIQDLYKEHPAIVRQKEFRPNAPFVADYLCGLHLDLDAVWFISSGISGDFCKHIGWALLFPEVIASHEPPNLCVE